MPERATFIDRSTFLRRAGGLFAIAVVNRSTLARLFPAHGPLKHPDVRDGITSEHVLGADAVASHGTKVAEQYEAARAYPALFDGIACGCSCGGMRKAEHRSLLACFETMQPTGCGACQMEADIVGKLAKEGKELDEIRKAIDKMYS